MNLYIFKLSVLIYLVFIDIAKAQNFEYLESKKLYNVQMHLHGHSHHNASKKPGSIQWHTHQAKDNSVDVIWWTEHDAMLNQRNDFKIDFINAYVDDNGIVIYNRESNFLPEYLETRKSNGISKITIINDSTIYLQLTHLWGQEARLSMSPRINKGKLAGFRLPRPLSSNAVLRFNLNNHFGGKNNTIKVTVQLSWHITQLPHQQSIEYILSDTIQSKSYHIPENGIVQYFLPAQNNVENQYSLYLYNDVQELDYGGDNTITDIQFELFCKDYSTISTYISNITITSLEPEPEHQLNMVDQFSQEYENIYNVKGISGIEYSPFREDIYRPHFNLFLPISKLNYSDIINVYPDDKFDYRELINNVHSNSGLVSFNHIFGTSIYQNGEYSEEVQQIMVDTTASFYMDKEIFNADILEVGYLSRGGVNLKNHLFIWDIFAANGFFLYGNGTTDAHGGIWKNEIANPFTTWIWAENSMDTSLLHALDSGRFYFGTFQKKIKKFFFGINNFKMGDRKYTDKESGELQIFIEPKPYNYTFRLIQGAVNNPGSKVEYIKNITFDPENPPVLDISTSCFIRLEVESIADRVKLFSNPIILLKRDEYKNTIYEERITQDSKYQLPLILHNPYPNPASNEVWIPFKLNNEMELSFNILNTNGEIIHRINLGTRTKGEYLSKLAGIYWNLNNVDYQKVSSGIYFIVSDNTDERISKKIIVQ